MRTTPLLLLLAALALAGCGATDAPRLSKGQAAVTTAKSCPAAWQRSWQKLANRIDAPVYCPSWLPDPLTGQIGGRWNNIDSVGKDRSYLIGFVWQEIGQEIHINLRGYPGVTKIPICRSVELVGGKEHTTKVPCFADARGQKTIAGFRVTEYTVNQDADQWHVLYAWRHDGSLYTLSQHVAPPLTFPMVVRNLNRELSRRAQDQSLNVFLSRVDSLQKRDAERRGLARAGSGLADEIRGSAEKNGQRLLLDFRRGAVSQLRDRAGQRGAQLQVIE